jgi:hypothetical protein
VKNQAIHGFSEFFISIANTEILVFDIAPCAEKKLNGKKASYIFITHRFDIFAYDVIHKKSWFNFINVLRAAFVPAVLRQ